MLFAQVVYGTYLSPHFYFKLKYSACQSHDKATIFCIHILPIIRENVNNNITRF
jgi:hypothetical protein